MLELTIGRHRFCFDFSFFLLIAVVCRLQNEKLFLLSILAIALHEFAHILAITGEKISVKSINFTAFGIHIVRSEDWCTQQNKLVWVYLAGPISNLLLALLFLGLAHGAEGEYFGSVNLLLGIVHLLPVGNLDGANALKVVLDSLFHEPQGRQISRWLSFVILFLLIPIMRRIPGGLSPTAWLLWLSMFAVTVRSE